MNGIVMFSVANLPSSTIKVIKTGFMNRKYFLSSLALLSVAVPFLTTSAVSISANASEKSRLPRVPPYLKPGDTIGITCPAGFIELTQILPSVKLMESWGYRVRIGKTVGARDFTLGGTDEERRADLQQMLDDDQINAIMCARGGYGAVRIIDQLNFKHFAKHPKWILGFSDITVLHCHLSRKLNIASIHSKMCNSFPADWSLADPVQIETILSIRQALSGQELGYKALFNNANRLGNAQGVLVGGNLSIIENMAGSMSALDTTDKILFLEDTGEYLYGIDRMLWNLKRSGKLAYLKGLIIGGFKVKQADEDEDFGKTIEMIVLEKVNEYNYPVCFDFPVGHQKNNFALKCGVKHNLEVQAAGSTLTSIF